MTEAVLPVAADVAATGIFRVALGVEYKGSRYRGFQRQRAGVPTIQETLENALSKVAGGAPVIPVVPLPHVTAPTPATTDGVVLSQFELATT